MSVEWFHCILLSTYRLQLYYIVLIKSILNSAIFTAFTNKLVHRAQRVGRVRVTGCCPNSLARATETIHDAVVSVIPVKNQREIIT